MSIRWTCCCVTLVLWAVATFAAPEIIDLLDLLDAAYDLTWQQPPLTGRETLTVQVDGTAAQPAYRLTLTATAATWTAADGAQPPVRKALSRMPGLQTYTSPHYQHRLTGFAR